MSDDDGCPTCKLDENESELFQALKDAPIELSEASEEEDVSIVEGDEAEFPEAEAAADIDDDFESHPLMGYTINFRDDNHDNDDDEEVDDEDFHAAQAEYEDYWRWFALRHPPAARAPRFLPLPPGAIHQPWIVPPLHADLRRLPFVSNRPHRR